MGDFVVYFQSVNWPSMHFFAFLGAFALYIVNRHQGSGPFSLLAAIGVDLVDQARPRHILCDMILTSLLGAAIVVPLADPSTPRQAVMAGLGVTGLLSARSGEPVRRVKTAGGE